MVGASSSVRLTGFVGIAILIAVRWIATVWWVNDAPSVVHVAVAVAMA